ncbi:hypothetical protein KHS38_03010 [Mucilaginibacter sp. Bleaf8]|uniref:hypothetical protein n=1 Tax=Mucilaginibacter sp. Bleaf8 TaxID=2834430 RepID=UPI001BCDD45C|nr:hypothetical protein [Mucilaginibacter sp. Bleaf8]MBS7563362.1 hypothetical protein [Mucilaginibacter sp. Bleaf8]
MKNLFTIILLLGCLYTAAAQKRVHQELHKSIHDDGVTLRIDIHGTSGDKAVSYNKSFDVKGWSKTDKDALVKRITDSLGVADAPKPPAPPTPPTPISSSTTGNHDDYHSSINDNGKTLHLSFSGSKQGKAFNYDRTWNVQGMSSQKKNALIKHITDSLGISEHVNPGTK